MFLPSAEKAQAKRRLVELFTETAAESVASNAAIEAATGRPINECRSIIYAALKVVNDEYGFLFVSARGEGYRRLPSVEAPIVGQIARKGQRRKARQVQAKLSNHVRRANGIEPPELINRLNTEIAVQGMAELALADRTTTMVAGKVGGSPPTAADVNAALLRLMEGK